MYLKIRDSYIVQHGLFIVCATGTLKDFGFDSDEEREHLAINGGEKEDTSEKVKPEEAADDGEQPKKKEKAAKAPVFRKSPPSPPLRLSIFQKKLT